MGLALIPQSISGFGSAAVSGTVQFYNVGTLTPVITFSDDAGTQPLSGALLLGATGAPATAVYTATPLRCIVKSSSGATLQDISRIDGDRAELVQVSNSAFTATDLNSVLTAIQSSTGGVDAQFFGTYSSKATTLKQEIENIGLTPQRFGALGNGVSDDTAAFQLLAAAQTSSGLPVFLPRGTYRISSTITFGSNLVLRGSGWGTSNGSVIQGVTATQGAIVAGGNFASISNLEISHNTSSTGIGLTVPNLSSVSSVFIHGYSTAIGGSNSFCSLTGSNISNGVNTALGASTSFAVDAASSQFLLAGSAFSATTLVAASASPPTSTIWTVDLANAGNVALPTPVLGQYIYRMRIRGTTSGGGTVSLTGAWGASGGPGIMILDFFNNTAGAFAFTLSGAFKTSGAISPGSGSRVCVSFTWEQADSAWVEMCRATST